MLRSKGCCIFDIVSVLWVFLTLHVKVGTQPTPSSENFCLRVYRTLTLTLATVDHFHYCA